MVSFFKGEHPLRPCNQIVRYQNASTMFCPVCNSSRQGSPEARRVLPSIANRVGDQVADRVGGDHPQTKAHLGEKQKLQTEGKGAPWKFAKADLWRLARQSLKKKQAILTDRLAGPIHLSGKVFDKVFLFTSATLSFGGGLIE